MPAAGPERGIARLDSSGPLTKHAIQLPLMKCPHCNRKIADSVLADDVFLLRTRCERCGKEFLIIDRVPMTEEQYLSRVHPAVGI